MEWIQTSHLKRITVPYTTIVREVRQRRLGGPVSLGLMAVVLAMIGWQLLQNGASGKDFSEARESLVAVLLFFPAILATQVERPVHYTFFSDRSIGAAVTLTNVAFTLPLMIAIGCLGPLSSNLVAVACFSSAAMMGTLAVWVYHSFVNEANLAIRRYRRTAREVAA